METTQCKVTVVGGGITGLSAAFYAESLFRSQGIPAEVTLAEESDRFAERSQPWSGTGV